MRVNGTMESSMEKGDTSGKMAANISAHIRLERNKDRGSLYSHLRDTILGNGLEG